MVVGVERGELPARLGQREACTEAQDEPTGAHQVDGGRLMQEQQWVTNGGQQHGGADRDAARSSGHGGEQGQSIVARAGNGAVADPHRVETDLFRPLGEPDERLDGRCPSSTRSHVGSSRPTRVTSFLRSPAARPGRGRPWARSYLRRTDPSPSTTARSAPRPRAGERGVAASVIPELMSGARRDPHPARRVLPSGFCRGSRRTPRSRTPRGAHHGAASTMRMSRSAASPSTARARWYAALS